MLVRLTPMRVAGALLLAGLVAAAAATSAAFVAAPSVADLPARVAALERAAHARAVPLWRIAPVLREAVVATEDERFYQHDGVDLISIARALPYDVTHWSLAQGASTIDEQLAKVAYLHGNDHSPWRKATEIALGFRIGRRFTHEQTLDDYLNVVYFGGGRVGIEAAARAYFGQTPGELDLAQASLLAGLIQAPSVYDPLEHPVAARDRQVAVLRSMVRNGYITQEGAAAVIASRLPLRGGSALAAVAPVSFAAGPPFDWDVLAFAGVLLAGALAAYVGARLLAPSLRLRHAVRLAGLLLLVASILTAARSVQVL